MNKQNNKINKKVFIIFILLIVTVFIVILNTISNQLRPSKVITPETAKASVISNYPESTSAPFLYPPPTIEGLTEQYNPYKIIEQADKDLVKDGDTDVNEEGKKRVHGQILPLATMQVSVAKFSTPQYYTTITLDKTRPFEGVAETLPFYSQQNDKIQTFIIKALLDGEEIQLGVKGRALNRRIELQLKSGEKSLLEFETEPIPTGVHEIVIVCFDFVNDDNLDAGNQFALGKYAYRSYAYKVFAGTATSQKRVDWIDWSISASPFPNLNNYMTIIDPGKTKQAQGFVNWKPDIYQPGEKVDYKIGLNNPTKGDREYCLISFLDYSVVNIQTDKKQVCGILKEKHLGIVDASFITPDKPGTYRLQILQLENPLMKESYLELRKSEQLLQSQTSGYFVIKVVEK